MNNNNNLYNILNNFNKLSESDTPKPAAEPKPKTLLESTMEEVLQEKYMGFKKTVSALKKQGGIEDPEALAASIGRKKHGKKAFQKAAAAGKKMGEGAPHPKELEMDAKVRSMQIQNRADAVEKRKAEKANEPKNIFQKVKKDIGEPLAKLAKGDVRGALGEADEHPQAWMDELRAMAHKMAPQDKMRERQAQRDAEEKAERKARIEQDRANLPELEAKYQAMRDEYAQLGGSNWQYADSEQNLSDRERQARDMEGALRHLANRIHTAKKGIAEGSFKQTPGQRQYGALHSQLRSLANSGQINTPDGKQKAEKMIDTIQQLVDTDPSCAGSTVPSKKIWLSEQGVAEGNPKNKYSNLSNRGVNRGINRAADDFDRMMDLDQVESPHYKTQHQKDTKQRLKTKPLAGPKGALPEESDWSNLGVEYRSTKPGTKEPTHTGEKEYFKGGVKHTKDYDREVSHTAATGEKRGRGRPKKSQFEGHYTIDQLIAEAFGEEDKEQSLNYEQDQLRNAIGDDLFAELQRSVRNGDYNFSDNLDDALYEYYFDDMPYGAKTGEDIDTSEWIGDRIGEVFSDEMSEGSIKGGVWTADPPKPGQPNVPMPKGDPEGAASTPKTASPGWGKDYKPLTPDTTKSPSQPATDKPSTGRTPSYVPEKPAKTDNSMGRIVHGTWQADPTGKVPAPSGDPEGVKEDKNTEQKEDIMMTNELAEMMRLAGMTEGKKAKPDYLDFDKDGDEKEPMKQALKDKKVDEAEEKADKDYDGDGKIESGKDEYLGSKISAAKKAGKLKEGEKVKEEKCMECGMIESKCKCDESIQEALNQMRRIAGLKECDMSPVAMGVGDMQQQQGKMNISTNMDSDGHKSVTITADGDSALELMQMLKLAGMGGHGSEEVDEQYLSEPIVAKPNPDDTTPAPTPAPPPAPPGSDGKEVEEAKDPRYHANTTPEEHVYPEQVLTRGGNGEVAGRNKQMHKHGYNFSDNPLAMKESVSMKLMKEYESIKIKK